jgi:cysteine desulfurase
MSGREGSRPIYLDHHATTPVDHRVAAVVVHAMTTAFGNANSINHLYGEEAAELVEAARTEVAALVGGHREGVHLTSGSSESIRLAVTHAASRRAHPSRPFRVVVSSVEHRAVLDAVAELECAGEAIVRWVPVDTCAQIKLDALEEACSAGADLVCVMAANNEVGTLYPIKSIAALAQAVGASSLIDATQAAGRIEICAADWGVTYLALSAHKIYGPKGVGALVMPPEISLRTPHIGIRGTGVGTPNVPGIVGLGEACRLRRLEMANDEPRISALRDRLETLLLESIPAAVVNGDRTHRLSHNLHLAVPGIPNDAVVARLRYRVALSTGAACTSGAQAPSHVLRAMRLPQDLQEGALRIGLGKFTSADEIERASQYIAEAVHTTRSLLAVTEMHDLTHS